MTRKIPEFSMVNQQRTLAKQPNGGFRAFALTEINQTVLTLIVSARNISFAVPQYLCIQMDMLTLSNSKTQIATK